MDQSTRVFTMRTFITQVLGAWVLINLMLASIALARKQVDASPSPLASPVLAPSLVPGAAPYGMNSQNTVSRFGFDLGIAALGHFGNQASLTAPAGGFLVYLSGHSWLNPLLEAHVTLGYGITSPFFTYGGGIKLNLLEVNYNPAQFSNSGEYQRGLLVHLLKSLMLYGTLDVTFLHFSDPLTPLGTTYSQSTMAIRPGIGAQWFFYTYSKWIKRIYLDTEVTYLRPYSNNFWMPMIGVGLEIR